MAEDNSEFRLTKKKQDHTRRGFVMTGGGAKGLYEAGVLQAFHLCNMNFDVITGSSIGAINSVAYAEYLYRKPQLNPGAAIADIIANIDDAEDFINTLHKAWLDMPGINFIDDTEAGALGRLKDDLTEFDIDLPMLTRLVWWWTTPEKDREPMPLMDVVKLIKELFERVGGRGTARIISRLRANGGPLPKVILDTYLECLDIDTALVLPESEKKLRDHFTGQHQVLTEEMLDDEQATNDKEEKLLPEERTLRQYYDREIDVRLTRANFRTGLLEISAYISKEAFARKVTSFWRFEILPEEGFPVTSFRLELPGNPLAIEAALASSRYPAVFSPYPLQNIYPAGDPENKFLYQLLEKDFTHSDVRDELLEEFEDDEEMLKALDTALKWLGNEEYESFSGRFFPRKEDRYLDGGAIDNTPTNSAIDAIREEIQGRPDEWRRDVTLDLYTVLLHRLPAQEEEATSNPTMYDVVSRTLEINSAAKLTTDVNYVEMVSDYGDRAEQLAEMLLVLLETVDELSDEAESSLKKENFYRKVREVASRHDERKFDSGKHRTGHFDTLMIKSRENDLWRGADKILPRIKQMCERWLDRGMPLDLNIVRIHPDKMPLHTVAFTERLGCNRHIQMITMGCYNTLWDLRTYLEEKPDHKLDEHDQNALELARKWTGIAEDSWPKDRTGVDIAAVRKQLKELKATWRCQRSRCIFHRTHCAHGADENGVFAQQRKTAQ